MRSRSGRSPGVRAAAVTALDRTPDGDLIVAGEFETAGGAPSGQIVRLETSNPAAYTLDPGFSAQTSAETGGKAPIGDVLAVGGRPARHPLPLRRPAATSSYARPVATA